MPSTVAQAVAEELRSLGVDRAFGLPGGEIVHLMEALREQGIDFTLCRHEANAGMMAAVYGRLQDVPGVVLTTLGPGAANLMLPLANSILDREPLVAITAQIPESWPASHTHQRLPLLECYGPVTKYAAAVDCLRARGTVRRAAELAIEEPAGPVYLTLSAEDAVAPCREAPVDNPGHANPRPGPPDHGNPGHRGASHGNPVATEVVERQDPLNDVGPVVEELRERLAVAERPLVLLGIGIHPGRAEALRRWIEAWNLPVAVTPKIKGIVDETGDEFVGVIGGMSIDQTMVDALHHADLVIGLGFDPVEVDKTWHAEIPIVWVLETPMALERFPHRQLLLADHGTLIRRLSEEKAPRTWDDPFAAFKETRREFLSVSTSPDAELEGSPVTIVKALAEVLPDETIVTTDVGSHKYLFGQFWPSRTPQSFLMSNGLSGMGYGLPAAMGAKLARPDVPVLAVLGDGGFSMNSQELETCRRIGTPIIVLVIADCSYSLIRLSQESKGLPRYGVDFDPIDSVGIAEACGVDGVRVTTAGQLKKAVEAAVREDRSVVVEVPVEVDAYKSIV